MRGPSLPEGISPPTDEIQLGSSPRVVQILASRVEEVWDNGIQGQRSPKARVESACSLWMPRGFDFSRLSYLVVFVYVLLFTGRWGGGADTNLASLNECLSMFPKDEGRNPRRVASLQVSSVGTGQAQAPPLETGLSDRARVCGQGRCEGGKGNLRV